MRSALHVSRRGQGPPLLFVHGSFAWGEQAFAAQAPLCERFRLIVIDRRGFGRSPDTECVDFELDAEDVVALLGEGAHLVGHSYGGVVCLLAAARAPRLVRSLTVIEPPAFGLARGRPEVERLIAAATRNQRERGGGSPAAFYAGFLAAWGIRAGVPERLTPAAERAFRSSMSERPPWEATLDLAALRAAGLPVLVVRGGWREASPEARATAGAAFAAVAQVLERELSARSACFAEANHRAHALGEPFNALLAEFVEAAERQRTA